jgi:hypothetical protein
LPAKLVLDGQRVIVTLAEPAEIPAGQALEIDLT